MRIAKGQEGFTVAELAVVIFLITMLLATTVVVYHNATATTDLSATAEMLKDDIRKVYLLAHKLGCKGVTVYRDGSRSKQVLSLQKEEQQQMRQNIIPRKRPMKTQGTTEKIVTGDGTLYLTINKDEQGLCEIFTNIGKHGSEVAAWSEAVGRLISLCLRSGVSLKVLVEQLRGITSRPIWVNGEHILSVPDAIGKTLSEYLTKEEKLIQTQPKGKAEVKSETCPDCGGPIEHESGCILCRICGFSR